jgi:hypothetical protein
VNAPSHSIKALPTGSDSAQGRRMLHAAEAFGLRVLDHWVWLVGILTEPLLDYHWEVFRGC